MKSMCKIAALIALLSVTGATAALAANIVTVANNTSYTMTELYASPTDSSTWDTTTNLLAGTTILPGAQATINIVAISGDLDCQNDLMAVLLGTTQHAYTYRVNTCTGPTWTITGN